MTNAITSKPATALAKRPTVAIALGGGGARGLAHLAMLEVLDELKVTPVAIAGTSIGALYGAGYAAGYCGQELRALTLESLGKRMDIWRQLFSARAPSQQKLFNFLPVPSALLDANTILDLVLPMRMPVDFAGLKIPLAVVATDLATREAVVLSEGPLKGAIAGSIAIPVIFAPVEHQGRLLADGGLVNPLPYDLLAGKADIIIAIDVSGGASLQPKLERPSAIDVFVTAVQILEKSVTRERLRYLQPDVYIDVDVDKFSGMDFFKAREILEACEPAKALLRRQLTRVMAAEPVRPLIEGTVAGLPRVEGPTGPAKS